MSLWHFHFRNITKTNSILRIHRSLNLKSKYEQDIFRVAPDYTTKKKKKERETLKKAHASGWSSVFPLSILCQLFSKCGSRTNSVLFWKVWNADFWVPTWAN